MDIIDGIIDLFYQYSRLHFIGDGKCEIYINDERKLRKRFKKILN